MKALKHLVLAVPFFLSAIAAYAAEPINISELVPINPVPEAPGRDTMFGSAMSVYESPSEKVVAVGAMADAGSGVVGGAVYVFRWNGSSWVQEQKILADDFLCSGRNFGLSLAISGDLLVVGGSNDNGVAVGAGAVYAFKRENGVWVQKQKIVASDTSKYDQFGNSVAISGQTIIVGAYRDGSNGDVATYNLGKGAAYIFRTNNGGNTWFEESKLTASDGVAQAEFGKNVSISGDVAIVGSPSSPDPILGKGAAYIYRRIGTQWHQEQKLQASGGSPADIRFGGAVGIFADLAAVGDYNDDDRGSNYGSATLFRFNGAQWAKETELYPSGANESNRKFGSSVAVTNDTVLVSSYSTGYSYVFRRINSEWIQKAALGGIPCVHYLIYSGQLAAASGNLLGLGYYCDAQKANVAPLSYVDGPSGIPTPTASATRTSTPNATPANTYTPTRTFTPTAVSTTTATRTPTFTATRINTVQPPTLTFTPTKTPTRTSTPLISNTPTRTPTRTKTPSRTSTPIITPNVPATRTATPTRTSTPLGAMPGSLIEIKIAGLGIDDGNILENYPLALDSSLIPNMNYKLLLDIRDMDRDGVNRVLNMLYFQISTTNASIQAQNGFRWLVPAQFSESDALNDNSLDGDTKGQVHLINMLVDVPDQALIESGERTSLKLAQLRFTAGSSGSIKINFDSRPYDGMHSERSLYMTGPNTFNINRGAGLSFDNESLVSSLDTEERISIRLSSAKTRVSRGKTIKITADPQNMGVSMVKFYVNAALKCKDSTPLYVCRWRVPNKKKRLYKLQAHAINESGEAIISDTINVQAISKPN